jgi:lisH domain-containing protein FOPNL
MSQQNNAHANEMLTTALKETLQRTGTLDNVRAQLRATILQNLTDSLPSATAAASNATPPTPPIENILINELISEYLSFNGYNQTLSVFAAETGGTQGTTMSGGNNHNNAGGIALLGKAFIRADLGLNGGVNGTSPSSLAMLYEIMEVLKSRKRQSVKRQR